METSQTTHLNKGGGGGRYVLRMEIENNFFRNFFLMLQLCMH